MQHASSTLVFLFAKEYLAALDLAGEGVCARAYLETLADMREAGDDITDRVFAIVSES